MILQENIHTTFDQLLKRTDREKMLSQKAKCFWLTGLSGSGKTTIAKGVEKKLHNLGFLCIVLDGDNIRSGISSNLTFSEAGRAENIRRIAEVNKLMNDAGVITLSSFISPTESIRELAANIIGDAFNEVFINTSIEACEARDVKGLYKKVRAGEIKNFTGIDAPYEAPQKPSLEIKTEDKTVDESIEQLFTFAVSKIKLK